MTYFKKICFEEGLESIGVGDAALFAGDGVPAARG